MSVPKIDVATAMWSGAEAVVRVPPTKGSWEIDGNPGKSILNLT